MIFMGVYRGDRSGSSDETQEDGPDSDQTRLDEHTETANDDDEAAAAVAAGMGAAAGTAAGAGAASGAGVAGATAASGAVLTDVQDPDEPGDDDGASEENDEVSEPGEDDEEPPESETEPAPEPPCEREPSQEEPSEQNQDNPEPDAEHEDPDVETEDDVDEELDDDEDEGDEEDEEDDEDEEAVTVTVTVDPLSAMSWGIQPVLKRVQERYDAELEYELAPVREFDDPAVMQGTWEDGAALHGMPVDSSLWESQFPPASTELLNSAAAAADRQDKLEVFLRQLWMRGIADGQDLSEATALANLAGRVGLDAAQFKADLETVEIDTAATEPQVPVTKVPIKGYTQSWSGYVRYTDFKQQFIFDGRDEQLLQPLEDFVSEHGPVVTEEVMEVYEWDRREAVEQLDAVPGVEREMIGRSELWR